MAAVRCSKTRFAVLIRGCMRFQVMLLPPVNLMENPYTGNLRLQSYSDYKFLVITTLGRVAKYDRVTCSNDRQYDTKNDKKFYFRHFSQQFWSPKRKVIWDTTESASQSSSAKIASVFDKILSYLLIQV